MARERTPERALASTETLAMKDAKEMLSKPLHARPFPSPVPLTPFRNGPPGPAPLVPLLAEVELPLKPEHVPTEEWRVPLVLAMIHSSPFAKRMHAVSLMHFYVQKFNDIHSGLVELVSL